MRSAPPECTKGHWSRQCGNILVLRKHPQDRELWETATSLTPFQTTTEQLNRYCDADFRNIFAWINLFYLFSLKGRHYLTKSMPSPYLKSVAARTTAQEETFISGTDAMESVQEHTDSSCLKTTLLHSILCTHKWWQCFVRNACQSYKLMYLTSISYSLPLSSIKS